MLIEHHFNSHTGRLMDKWAHYLPIYEKHFAKFAGTTCRVLEIGVNHGGSLQLWKNYFGMGADIIGLDIDPRCLDYAEEQISIYQVDQGNYAAMKHVADTLGPFDIIIDDGSHWPEHQKTGFKALYPALNTGGIYLIEDCHHGFPALGFPALVTLYPWVMVIEAPERRVVGTPSRPLNDDEKAAYGDLGYVVDVGRLCGNNDSAQ